MKYCILFLIMYLACYSQAQHSLEDSKMAKVSIDSLFTICIDYASEGDMEEALKLLEKTEKISIEYLGDTSFEYAMCSYYTAHIYELNHEIIKSEEKYSEAIKRFRDLTNKQPILYATAHKKLGNLYLESGQIEKADSFYMVSISHLDTAVNVELVEYASLLNDMAISYIYMGFYGKAEPMFIKAMELNEKSEKIDTIHYTHCLNNLALLYEEMGYFEKSEPLHQKSIDLIVKLLGKNNLEYAGGIFNLATLYHAMGDYVNAEILFLEAETIITSVADENHPIYTNCLNNLGNLYWELGNLENAEKKHQKIKEIRAKNLGPNHPDYARCLDNLAGIQKDKGNLEEAEYLSSEAYQIFLQSYTKPHPTLANSLNNLASIQLSMGNLESARKLYNEALSMVEIIFGKEHPFYANILYNLGDSYLEDLNYSQATIIHTESKNIREIIFQKNHQDYANSVYKIGVLNMLQGKMETAEKLFSEFVPLNENLISQAVYHLTEKELGFYIQSFKKQQNTIFAAAHLSNSAELSKLNFNSSLFYKGFILSAVNQTKQISQRNPQTKELYNQLKSVRRRLSEIYSSPMTIQDDPAQLESEASLLEKNLVRLAAGFEQMLKKTTWLEIKSSLNNSEVALEFIHFNRNIQSTVEEITYGALIVTTRTEQPIFIHLFEENELDYLLTTSKERKADYVNELYGWADRGMVKLGSEKKSLYELIWAKIQSQIPEGTKTIYYSPSGVLHLLNLGAIPVDDETILSDKYNLVAMNSTRQLVIPSKVNIQSNNALLVGGVNFDVDSLLIFNEDEPLLASRSMADAWTAYGTRGGTWSYLKWTEKEVERIGSSLSTSGFDITQLTDSEATEEAIKAIGSLGSSPRILHIATHGFFFPDPEVKNAGPEQDEAEPAFKSSDNPMIRSGLILAGGNYAWQHGRSVSPDIEDGILTAYEISQMNLSNTELVVLSACETGLGDIQGNEGVYGLQRAFKIAGAKYLIMSLWQVPDRETMEFMTTFYRNWLEEEMTIPDAFRKTQREMRDRFFNPYSWAGFVLVE